MLKHSIESFFTHTQDTRHTFLTLIVAAFDRVTSTRYNAFLHLFDCCKHSIESLQHRHTRYKAFLPPSDFCSNRSSHFHTLTRGTNHTSLSLIVATFDRIISTHSHTRYKAFLHISYYWSIRSSQSKTFTQDWIHSSFGLLRHSIESLQHRHTNNKTYLW